MAPKAMLRRFRIEAQTICGCFLNQLNWLTKAPDSNRAHAPPSSRNAKNMLNVALYEPEIPPNTGNIARLCAATRTNLHIVGVTGFRMDDRMLRRAGLDYWDEVNLFRHVDLEGLFRCLPESRFICLTTKGVRSYTDWRYHDNDCMVFGPETRGLPPDILQSNAESCITIPMANPNVRSLNLATSVGIVLYEAIRQLGSR